MKYDCIVIGGGIVGCATLDRLARRNLRVLLLEKQDDVASFSTRANSGIVHAGYDCEPNTLKALFNMLSTLVTNMPEGWRGINIKRILEICESEK